MVFKEDINRNDKGQKHGLCIIYHSNGNVYGRQRYANGKLNGISEWYLIDGKIGHKEYYKDGESAYDELHYIFYYINGDENSSKENRIEFWI